MRRSSALVVRPTTIGLAFMLATLLALIASVVPAAPGSSTAQAQDASAECGTADGEQGKRQAYIDYEELGKQLDILDDKSEHVEVDVATQSTQGRDVYRARVGDGDSVLLMTADVHGNEHSGSKATLRVLEWLGGPSPAAQEIRENVTLVAFPMYNVDGSELDQRQTAMSWDETVDRHPQLEDASIPWYYSFFRGGYDLNRDFNPDLGYEPVADDLPGTSTDPGFFLHPESDALRHTYLDLQDEFGEVDAYADLHHMGACQTIEVDGEERYVTVAIDYPPLPPWEFEEGGRWEDYPNMRPASRQLNMAFAFGIEERMGGGVSDGIARYFHPDWRDYPGQTRSSLALNGTATVLVEIPGQTQQVGNQQAGRKIKIVETGIRGMLDGLATGDVWEYDDQAYYDLWDAYWE